MGALSNISKWTQCLTTGFILDFQENVFRTVRKIDLFGSLLAPYWFPLKRTAAASFEAGDLPSQLCEVTRNCEVNDMILVTFQGAPTRQILRFTRFSLKESTFCHINGRPKQYIQVDTMFNYRFHFGLPGKCL